MAKASPDAPANRLAHETSPYLQQHAHNPVDWHPWGAEALELAKTRGVPILLSVGYSACHWCHVMAHESFEDEATARLMNELFVNIKVDREERPDIDRIYQVAQQLITQKPGGWPLTMFLSHEDQRPFFGGTYFPKEPRHGMPVFVEILKRVAEYYSGHQAELRQQNEGLMTALEGLMPTPPATGLKMSAAPLRVCREELFQRFDSNYGGFSGAPKFPHPRMLERVMRDWQATAVSDKPDLQALYMATLTLTRMGEGGLYDQLAGGFCRYSVDSHWMIPHFEKMLYDNAALLSLYAEAAAATGDLFYAEVAAATAGWLIRDMQSPEGGYYSSLDADSEGHEGKFYAWDREEVRQALTPEEFSIFASRYGLDRSPNFEGKWHLHTYRTVAQVANAAKVDQPHALRVLESARTKLLAIREKRVWPGRDEKILTSWNAMTIRGMAVVARVLARDDLAESATRALDFIRKTLWKDGRLLATYKDGRAHLNAYLDDYVYLADAILELQQVRFRADELAFARELLDAAMKHFEDEAGGGFYFTSDDHEALIQRMMAFGDDAIPSGNGVAAFVLQRMGHLLGEPRYLESAERTLRAAYQGMENFPYGHTTLLGALEELLTPPEIVILRGERNAVRELQKELAKVYAPHRLVLAVPSDATALPPAIADKKPGAGVLAYVCRGSVCSAPVDNITELAELLRMK